MPDLQMTREHAALLLSEGANGIRVWNKAVQDGATLPSLGRLDLRGQNLIGADLRGADLRSADLSNADLTGADLSYSRVDGATFDGANLAKARLRAVSGRGATFLAADLTGADLTNSSFNRADMHDAGLENVVVGGAAFRGLVNCPRTPGSLRPNGRRKNVLTGWRAASFFPRRARAANPLDAVIEFVDHHGARMWRTRKMQIAVLGVAIVVAAFALLGAYRWYAGPAVTPDYYWFSGPPERAAIHPPGTSTRERYVLCLEDLPGSGSEVHCRICDFWDGEARFELSRVADSASLVSPFPLPRRSSGDLSKL